MKTVKQTTKTTESEVKQEFNLKEAFVLWKNKSEKGNDYLKGYVSMYDPETDKMIPSVYLIGYFNTNKENPKQPDIRIYQLVDGEQDQEVASLWSNVSENKGTKYLTGSTNDKEKLVAFYSKDKDEKKPYIRAYYKEN